MNAGAQYLWQPLLEGAAQTITGMLGSYGTAKIIQRLTAKNTFAGAMDFWRRGIHERAITTGDHIVFDGLISPYSQLFPGDPMRNGIHWNRLYEFEGKISKEGYQAMEFYVCADVALRLKSLNGETVVGLYNRYGYVGDGLVGVVPTSLLLKSIPDFFHPDFFGARARVYGQVDKCPSAHFAAATKIVGGTDISLDMLQYRKLYYLRIKRISLATKQDEKLCTLLGSPWAVTESKREQYLIQYGYFSEPAERRRCLEKIYAQQSWNRARVFFDDVENPSQELSFKQQFIK